MDAVTFTLDAFPHDLNLGGKIYQAFILFFFLLFRAHLQHIEVLRLGV